MLLRTQCVIPPQKTKIYLGRLHISVTRCRARKLFILEPMGSLTLKVLVQVQACGRSGFLMGSIFQPRVDRMEGVNGVATQIGSSNHMYSALVEELIFTKARVRRLGMKMGSCQAPNPTQPIGQPPRIVFQILVPSKGLLTCSSYTHTHSNMHLTHNMTYYPKLKHGIRSYHSYSARTNTHTYIPQTS